MPDFYTTTKGALADRSCAGCHGLFAATDEDRFVFHGRYIWLCHNCQRKVGKRG